ncbi:MAG TPA: hypothetical protein VFB96_07965 [Pirellulaceae bacterium]|jgi:hypothetical protein|nr:hypothetical protein [Pirellulaceae bacterium]
MDDELDLRLDARCLEEIQELLAAEGHEVSLEQAQMIANFVQEVGGLDEALHVLSELREDRHAA